jgi:probable F420-dependent oxidoreductase
LERRGRPPLKLKLGTYLPNFAYGDDGIDHAARLRHWIVRSEELGFESIWVTDHLLRARNMYARTWLEPLSTLAFAAALTRSALLGPSVLLLPLRQPVILAKTLASLQRLAGGRLVLGVGTGWFEPELRATGAALAERGRRTDEVLALLRRLLSGESVSHRGQFYDVSDVLIEPSPVALPVWVGGGSQADHPDSVEKPRLNPNVARRIARSDGWFTRPSALPEQIVHDWVQLQPYLEAEGRRPEEIAIAHGQWVFLTEEDRRDRAVALQHAAAEAINGTYRPRDLVERTYLFGTLDEIVEACRVRAQIGVQHLVLHPYTDDPDQLELWGRELLPRLRELEVAPRPA